MMDHRHADDAEPFTQERARRKAAVNPGSFAWDRHNHSGATPCVKTCPGFAGLAEQRYEGFADRDPEKIRGDVFTELARAESRFGPYASGHEGWAVIKEELDELWDEVRLKTGTPEGRYKEAMQVAATAIRFMKDVKN